MYKVNKCLYCFDLRYGYFTYATIFLIFRVALIMALWNDIYLQQYFKEFQSHYSNAAMLSISYLFATSFALFVAMQGIIQERSVLMYPYLVMCAIELAATVATNNIWAIFLLSAMYLIIGGGIEVYISICESKGTDRIKVIYGKDIALSV